MEGSGIWLWIECARMLIYGTNDDDFLQLTYFSTFYETKAM